MLRDHATARLLVCALALAGLACRGGSKTTEAPPWPPLESAELGSMPNVSFSDGVWIGGTPTPSDLDLARRRGIVTVVDLRTREERPSEDVALACRELGLEYVDMGLRPEETPDSAVDQVLHLLSESDSNKVLLFCSDGSRSAMFLAVHRVLDQGLPLEKALAEARRSGMPQEGEVFVRRQVERLSA